MSEAPTWAGLDAIKPLCERLLDYNEWRRGLTNDMPHPVVIGADIDNAIRLLTVMSRAIRTTLDNNLNLADGDVCTLIELKRVSEKV